MNDIKVKNRRVNKKKALIMILLGITILGVINRTWAYVDEQIKIKAEQERLAEEKRKAEEEKKKYMVGVSHEAKKYSYDAKIVSEKLSKYDYSNNGEKVVFLTFDDGTSKTNTPEVLRILKENNIPVLDCKCYYKNEEVEDIIKSVEENIEYPVIVKPINLGSSIGIVVAKNREELEEAIEDAFTYARKILIEKAIKNLKEVNCSVLGDYEECNASECEELDKTADILSYEDKYISGGKKTGGAKQSMNAGVLKLPANISEELKENIQTLAKETFKILGCTGVIRIDFLIDEDTDKVYVNEVNTIPGCLSFHLWRAAGMEYPELLDKEIELALKRNREENNMVFSFDTNVLEGYANGGLKGGKGKLA